MQFAGQIADGVASDIFRTQYFGYGTFPAEACGLTDAGSYPHTASLHFMYVPYFAVAVASVRHSHPTGQAVARLAVLAFPVAVVTPGCTCAAYTGAPHTAMAITARRMHMIPFFFQFILITVLPEPSGKGFRSIFYRSHISRCESARSG
jgi:hypothetical protein